MKNIRTLLMLLLMVSIGTAYAYQRDNRDLKGFDEISLGVSAHLHLSIGNEFKVEMEGDEDDMDEIETKVENGVLKIRHERRSGWSWNMDRVDIYVTMPEVNGLRVSGSGSIRSEDTIKSDDLELAVSGSGDLEVDIDARMVNLSISGSGDVELSGKAGEFKSTISGSGGIDAFDLVIENCDVRISGSGSVRVEVTGSLDARISGSGSVYYEGDPENVNSSTSGSGRVRKR